jgi:adenylate cyclase class 2
MGQEIEAKYRLEDPDSLRARLTACGARRVARLLEANRLFDTADGKLREADCGLRLRTSRSLDDDWPVLATLTYKGPRTAGEMKAREEVEIAVADWCGVATILQRLGFNDMIFYEKRRESWQLADCEVCADELPRLGWFVEIEGPSAESVGSAASRLGLRSGAAVPETYVELVARHGQSSAEGHRSLRFDT